MAMAFLIKSKWLKLLGKLAIFLLILELVLQLISYKVHLANQSNYANLSKKSLRILCVGESTSSNVQSSGEIIAWPLQLEKFLNQNGIPAQVFNMAVPATNTNLILSRIPQQILEFQPHVIISMMGANDSSLWINEKENSILTHSVLYRYLIWFLDSVRLGKETKKEILLRPNVILKKDFTNNNKIKVILDLFIENESTKANALLEKFIANINNIEKAQIFEFLGEKLLPGPQENADKFQIPYILFKKSIETNFWVESIIEEQTYVLRKLQKDDEALELIKHYLDSGGIPNDYLFTIFSHYSKNGSNKNEWENLIRSYFKNQNIDILYNETRIVTTRKNYLKLYKIAHENHIVLIPMQYPIISAKPLEFIFTDLPDQKDLFFISNQDNFVLNLKNQPYSDFFVDRFGGDYGHMTNLGHKALSENVGKTLLSLIKAKKIRY